MRDRIGLSFGRRGGRLGAAGVVIIAGLHFAGYAGAQSIMASGYTAPLPASVAPGQLLTIYAQGIGAGLAGRIQAQSLPLPTSLAGISASIRQSVGPTNVAAPILAIFPLSSCGNTFAPCEQFIGIDLQIPFELISPAQLATGVSANSVNLTVSENGAPRAVVGLTAASDQIHILRYGDTLTGSAPGAMVGAPVVTHADGSLVSLQSPAQPGETVVIYAFGIGMGLAQDIQSVPAPPATGAAPTTPLSTAALAVGFDFRPNATPSKSVYSPSGSYSGPTVPTWLVAGNVGLYQVNVTVPQPPSRAKPCGQNGVETNLTIDLRGAESYDGAPICVALPSK